MNTRYPPVPQIIGARPQFKYSAPWSDCRIIHEHDCMGIRLLIVGDPDCGGYEWVILTSGKVQSHSNDGYGISEVALRDGLIEAFKDCFTAKPNPAHKEALEKMHELLAAENSDHHLEAWTPTSATAAAESLRHCQEVERQLLQPLQARAKARSQSAASPAPHAGQDSAASASCTSESPEAGPDTVAMTPATSTAGSGCPASVSAVSNTDTPHPPLHASSAPTPENLPASAPPGTPAPASIPEAGPPSLPEAAAKTHSSAKPSASAAAGKQPPEDSCGDINGDGLCHLR